MAIFKCKMCGGGLDITDGVSVAVCEYCGTKQTLPKLSDEKKANLYDRANHFRRNNEFDKAMAIYEQILIDDNTDAETYWSLVLCRYGIEYIEDPSSHRRIPTVNRAQFTSIFDDEDYKAAIKYSDDSQREIYESEANTINQIHKKILAISNQEEPFDIFICYKESDSNGRRTPDSVLATELYHELTREGYKVFFSRITLEDKLGTAYEPYIFAALNSSKVMIVLGTKPEYFNAVWVKNEWSRYLSLIKKGEKKILVPAYKDMDPYDLPEEFSHLQAQDMSRLGFMQDLIRGISKIIQGNTYREKPSDISTSNNYTNHNNLSSIIRRAFMAVEDGEWPKAYRFSQEILNIDPTCADAYLIKLFADLKVKNYKQLSQAKRIFENNPNYKKAVSFGREDLKVVCKQVSASVIQIKNKRKRNLIKTAKIVLPSIVVLFILTIFLLFFNPSKINNVSYITTYDNEIIFLTKDGTVLDSEGEIFDNITAISKKNYHSLFLKDDGTVLSLGSNDYGERSVDSWSNIIDIATGYHHSVGLRKDGTVLAVGEKYNGRCNVHDWKDITAVAAGYNHTVGLKSNGTVLAVGSNAFGQCNVTGWTNVDQIEAGKFHTVALKKNGTVVAVGSNEYGQCNVSGWDNIVAIAVGDNHTIGLKEDGTVVAVGKFSYGQCDVDDWKNIETICAGDEATFAIKKNGQIVYAYYDNFERFTKRWYDKYNIFN